jgi:hypothetical protein
VGHFASESLVLETLARRLRAGMADAGIQATVSASSIEKDPFCLMF